MGTRQKFHWICALAVLALMGGTGCKPPGARAMFEGKGLLQAGKPKEAVIQFEQATQYLPMEWRAWNFLGLARHRAGNLEGANQAYQKAVELVGKRRYSSTHPSFVLEFNMGRLCLDQNRSVEAQRHLSTFAQQDQSYPSCYWLAEAYRANGHNEAAAEMLARAITARSDSAITWNRLGVVQLKLGQATKAILSFENALEYKKDFAEAQRNLAITYHRHASAELENSEELALQAFKKYLGLEPADADAVQLIVDALESMLHPERSTFARATINQLAGTNSNTILIPPVILEPPLKPLVESNIIVLREQLPGTNAVPAAIVIRPNTRLPVRVPPNTVTASRPTAPEKTVVITLSTPPTPPKKTSLLPTKRDKPPVKIAKSSPTAKLPEKVRPKMLEIPGIARYQYNRPGRPRVGDNEKARKVFNRAYYHHKLNQLDEAIVGYREVLLLDPSFQQAHLNSAIAYQSKGEFEKALLSYEVALKINPLSHKSRQGFATALNASKYYVDAAKEYETLLEKFPAHTTEKLVKAHAAAHLDLAGVYANQLKLPKQAKLHFRQALKLNPNHDHAPAVHEWLSQNP